ncbi:phage tail protein [Pseudomonas sp. Fl4BN1]|nr:phage tail protein [Pseudomonas sp. Fl4BN1]
MIDSNSQFFAILTAVGEAKQANATALGTPWTFKEMAVGDANGTDPIPSKTQTKLVNEWRRAPVNQVRTDPANPNIIITEQVIPPDVGGRWIREIGLFDADGDLVAVANCAPSFKPLLAQGTGKTQVIRMNFIVANTAQIVLKIDPAVVLATREYVDNAVAGAALPADKKPGAYRQVTIDKRGIVLSGANPTTLGGYGITDAYSKVEVDQLISSVPKQATEAVLGMAKVATQAQIDEGVDNTTFITPLKLSWRVATETIGGTAKVATQLQVLAGTDDSTIVTPKKLHAALPSQATEAIAGVARVATQAQIDEGTDNTTFITPLKLSWRVATETVGGTAKIATQLQVRTGADDSTIVTPKKLQTAFSGRFIHSALAPKPTDGSVGTLWLQYEEP